MEGQRQIVREIPLYNLDVIISVGYRVNSKNATSFRRWATSVLKQYIIKGYAINQQIKLDRYKELKDVVRLMSRAIGLQEEVSNEEYGGLFNVISDYVYALDTLDHYDYQSLAIQKTTSDASFHATYDNAMEAINALRISLVEANGLQTRKTSRSRVVSDRFIKRLTDRNFTLP